MIKKGTRIICTAELTEGGPELTLFPGDTFIQSEDFKWAVQKGHKYGGAWEDFMKIDKVQPNQTVSDILKGWE